MDPEPAKPLPGDPAPDPAGGDLDVPAGIGMPPWVDEAAWAARFAGLCEEGEPEDPVTAFYDDPDVGPPLPWEQDESWEVLTARAEKDGAEYQALVARLAAEGCSESAHVPGGPPVPGIPDGPAAGFGQGRPLDAAAPSTVVSGLADEASGEDRSFQDVTDDQLIGLVGARARLAGRQQWEELTAVAEFIRRRPHPDADPALAWFGMPEAASEDAAADLAAQLHVSGGVAAGLICLARDLVVKLPATRAALRDGIVDLDKARAIAMSCLILTPAEAREAERILFGSGSVEEMTGGMVRDRIARAVIEVNPDAARRRREAAQRTKRVEMFPELSGNTAICGRELPPELALAAIGNIEARARALRAAGIAGDMDCLRTHAYLDMLGAPLPAPATSTEPGTGSGSGTEPGSAPGDAGSGPGTGVPGTGDACTGTGPAGGPGDDRPADSPADSGNADSGNADSGNADGGDADGGDADGGTGDGGPGPGGPGPGGPGNGGPGNGGPRPGTPGGGTGAGPVPGGFAAKVNLTIAAGDLTIPLLTFLGLAERPGTMSRLGPVDPDLARALAAAAARSPASTWCITITGTDHRPVAHGCGRPPPRQPRRKRGRGGGHPAPAQPGSDHDPPPTGTSTGTGTGTGTGTEAGTGSGAGTWPRTIRLDIAALTGTTTSTPGGGGGAGVLEFKLENLAGPCDHAHQAAGHDPGTQLRHLTGILNQTCTYLTCRRPHRTCDYEHSTPFEKGGRTCLCDGGPVCRHHHRDKQAPGWRLQNGPNRGWFTWTTATGRTYTTKPTQYPD